MAEPYVSTSQDTIIALNQRAWQLALDAKALEAKPQTSGLGLAMHTEGGEWTEVGAAAHPSGITPVEFNVLILPNAVEEVTKGGIIRPVETLDKDKYAQMEGRIVAVSPLAFTYVTESEWNGQKPGVGDRIIIAKYAGTRVKGDDGVEYVLMKDRDVTAVRK